MKEIGGYIEYEYNHGKMLHGDAIKLNCGRRAFSYLIKSRNIKKIWIPRFTCGSVIEPCIKEKIEYKLYSVNIGFLPDDPAISPEDWVYIINYYGQITNEKIEDLRKKYPKLIIDNTQAYFQMPIDGVDTFYTCRKFFGVADGAVLYTASTVDTELDTDESYARMTYILGRFERSASEFYSLYDYNNSLFSAEPIKRMSRLTENILKGLDYDRIKEVRTQNFKYLHLHLEELNKLDLIVPEGAFMYPLYIDNGHNIRKKLIEKKIYIPTLWPDTYDYCNSDDLEYDMAKNILPLPVDQRYGEAEMKMIIDEIQNNKKVDLK